MQARPAHPPATVVATGTDADGQPFVVLDCSPETAARFAALLYRPVAIEVRPAADASDEAPADAGAAVFPALVAAELSRARAGHRELNSLHEGYAVLLEEVDELWDEIKRRSRDRDPRALLAELVQVAAVAQRIAEDRGLLVLAAAAGDGGPAGEAA